jgi:hypothetical protein
MRTMLPDTCPRHNSSIGSRSEAGGSDLNSSTRWLDGSEAPMLDQDYPDDVTGCKLEANWR